VAKETMSSKPERLATKLFSGWHRVRQDDQLSCVRPIVHPGNAALDLGTGRVMVNQSSSACSAIRCTSVTGGEWLGEADPVRQDRAAMKPFGRTNHQAASHPLITDWFFSSDGSPGLSLRDALIKTLRLWREGQPSLTQATGALSPVIPLDGQVGERRGTQETPEASRQPE
jgi:hypothetical protein